MFFTSLYLLAFKYIKPSYDPNQNALQSLQLENENTAKVAEYFHKHITSHPHTHAKARTPMQDSQGSNYVQLTLLNNLKVAKAEQKPATQEDMKTQKYWSHRTSHTQGKENKDLTKD